MVLVGGSVGDDPLLCIFDFNPSMIEVNAVICTKYIFCERAYIVTVYGVLVRFIRGFQQLSYHIVLWYTNVVVAFSLVRLAGAFYCCTGIWSA